MLRKDELSYGEHEVREIPKMTYQFESPFVSIKRFLVQDRVTHDCFLI